MINLFAFVWRTFLRFTGPPVRHKYAVIFLTFPRPHPYHLLSRCLSLFADDIDRQLPFSCIGFVIEKDRRYPLRKRCLEGSGEGLVRS